MFANESDKSVSDGVGRLVGSILSQTCPTDSKPMPVAFVRYYVRVGWSITYAMEVTLAKRETMIKFLEQYRELSCLWDTSHSLYNCREARNQALQTLLETLEVIEADATIASVKKRIDNMRTAYKREWRKVQESKRIGSSTVIHVPTLWYYNYFTFLQDKDPLSDSRIDTSSICDDEKAAEFSNTRFKQTPVKRRSTTLVAKEEQLNESTEDLFAANDNTHNLFAAYESTQNPLVANDNTLECYGRVVGLQLQEMTHIQRCIAEKLISEVIFYGKLDKLTVNSSVTIRK